MNNLSSELLENITSFLDKRSISKFVSCDTSTNSIKFETAYFDYDDAMLYSDIDKHKIKHIIKCDDTEGLLKFTHLSYLSFVDFFDERIEVGKLPHTLKTLKFGIGFSNCRRSIKKGDLPDGIKKLVFGDNFENGRLPLEKGVLPENLQILKFGEMFDNGYTQIEGTLPKNIKKLRFGTWFVNGNQPIKKGDFPEMLESITFGELFDNGGFILHKQDLSDNILYATFGCEYIRYE